MIESTFIKSQEKDLIKKLSMQMSELLPVCARLQELTSLQAKENFLDSLPKVHEFFNKRPDLFGLQVFLSGIERYLLKILVVMDQAGHVLCFSKNDKGAYVTQLVELLDSLIVVEDFYDQIGGVLGYYYKSIELLYQLHHGQEEESLETLYPPKGVDIDQDTGYVRDAIIQGIIHQAEMAELYPVGGAADRLKLQDEKTHEDLPAARLEFLGHTLLEGIIRDLQAREYLYFRLFHKQVTTPIALMTSHEKNNHELVQEIIQQAKYFGRDKESFKMFAQPLVPTFTEEGNWCLKAPMQLLLKPGGHGVIWKLAVQEKILEWFLSLGRKKVLVRQINNPIAGVDLGLIALTGVGCKEKKLFGFASCERRVKTSEGMNVLKERVSKEGIYVTLSNIEYCDFKKLGIQDRPQYEGDSYSVFPSNTNILFADIAAMNQAVDRVPYPGMLVNLKAMKHYGREDPQGAVARLELLMQNIADAFEEKIPKSVQENLEPDLSTFIVFNKRHKTISPTKKQFIPKSGLIETALGCFYDYLKNCRELLQDSCGFSVPDLPREDDFLKEGPSFIAVYNPCLGPLYSVISQKIYNGSLAKGSELQLEIAEVKLENLSVEGSLLIQADQVIGHKLEGVLCYSNLIGRCYLKNVCVKNQGVDFSKPNVFWKNTIYRKQSCSIRLEGASEFRAENVTLQGDVSIVVKDGERVTALQENGCVVFIREQLRSEENKSYWQYTIAPDQTIQLTFQG